jgi:predicted nucleic acid-binding protein
MTVAPARDLVLDASVAIKWYVPEVHTAEALRFMAPAYAMHAYPRLRHDAEALAPLAFDLALAVGNAKLALYDFFYLALAVGLNCRLVTVDRMFFDALASGPYGPHLLWVADAA